MKVRLCFYLCLFYTNFLLAQSLALDYQNPSSLSVCDTAVWVLRVANTGTTPATGNVLTLTLPPGIEYVTGSVTGATEGANPSVFSFPDLAGGATATCSLRIHVVCAAASFLDAGNLFPIQIQMSGSAGSASLTTLPLKVETPLVRIDSVSTPQTGSHGDTLRRRICFRNTRLGAVQSVHLTDDHNKSFYRTWIEGAVLQGTDSTGLFHADLTSSYFAAFGDGDNRLEYNESACVTQVMVVEDCIGSFVASYVSVGWTCTSGMYCRSDGMSAPFLTNPYPLMPALKARYELDPPVDRCGQYTSDLRLILRNVGSGPATNILTRLTGLDSTLASALEGTEVTYQGSTVNAKAFASPTSRLLICAREGYDTAYVSFPTIAPGDSLTVHFKLITCSSPCISKFKNLTNLYSYKGLCPGIQTLNDSLKVEVAKDVAIATDVKTEIGDCVQPDSTYTWTYTLRSKYLLLKEGQMRIHFKLPPQLHWAGQCLPGLISGRVPLVETDQKSVTVLLDLPLQEDSIAFPFCMTYICDPGHSCTKSPRPRRRGSQQSVYAGMHCEQICNTTAKVETSYVPKLQQLPECALGTCHFFVVNLNFLCDTTSEIDTDTFFCNANSIFIYNFSTRRLNYDYADNDDNRMADPGLLTADGPGVRRDRLLPGDTLQVVYEGTMLSGGGLSYMPHTIWNEVSQKDQFKGPDTSDVFNVGTGREIFTNFDYFKFLRQTVVVHYKDGSISRCVVSDSAYSRTDQHLYEVRVANLIPYKTEDKLITQNHHLRLNLFKLYQEGCLLNPSLEEGDQITIYSDFQIDFNYTPFSTNEPDPPLVSFRTALAHRRAPYAWDSIAHVRSQYSGYRYQIRPEKMSIRSCAQSLTHQPFMFRMRIARANMFPYEVRPLVQIGKYFQNAPKGLTMQSALLRRLFLQDSTLVHSDIPLPVQQMDTLISVDFTPAFTPLPDEGFHLEASTLFPPNCHLKEPDTSRLTLHLLSKNSLYADKEHVWERYDPIGYQAGSPSLWASPPHFLINQSTRSFDHHFAISNNLSVPAPNFWMRVLDHNARFKDITLRDSANNQLFTPDADGFYRPGDLPGVARRAFTLTGSLSGCGTDTMRILYGWACTPVKEIVPDLCGLDTFSVAVEVQAPELELKIQEEPDSLLLCVPSDFYEVELYNANEGYAYHLEGNIQLPEGLSVVPQSSEISYPAGTPFQPFADPLLNAPQTYLWKLSDWLPALATNGLADVTQAPLNALRLRFRVTAACGAEVNKPPVLGATSVSNCANPSNTLNKPGTPIHIAGTGKPGEVSINMRPVDGALSCGTSQTFEVELQLMSTSRAGDSIVVSLPKNIVYKANSYQRIQNIDDVAPAIQTDGFRVAIPAALDTKTICKFRFAIEATPEMGCTDPVLSVKTRTRSNAFCASLAKECGFYIATGSVEQVLHIQHNKLSLQKARLNMKNGRGLLSCILQNNGSQAPAEAKVEAWRDLDKDGKISSQDVLLQKWDNIPLVWTGTTGILQNLILDNPPLCDLILKLPGAGHCSCEDQIIPVQQYEMEEQSQNYCRLQSVTLNPPTRTGFTYLWSPVAGLSCTDCATTTFTPDAAAVAGQQYALSLTESRESCTIQHAFVLKFSERLELRASATRVCKGKEIILQPYGPVSQWAWSGPGISDPAKATQTLVPTQSAQYILTATLNNGCRDTAAISIQVLKSDTTLLPELTTCTGQTVQVLGQPRTQAGTYRLSLLNQAGCDSTIFQTLRVLPQPTFQTEHLLCEGDTLRVADTLLTQSGRVCRQYRSFNGCDSFYCAVVNMRPRPVLPVPDTLRATQGEPVVLKAPAGFQQYHWLAASSNCDTCSTLTLQPDSAGLFRQLLRVSDALRCTNTMTYLLLVLPPCDPATLLLPNTFTPDGDGVNDVFRPVPFDGEIPPWQVTLQVYNRWGQRIYVGSGPQAAWNGTVDSLAAPSDTYIYLLDIECTNNLKGRRKGEIILLR